MCREGAADAAPEGSENTHIEKLKREISYEHDSDVTG